MVSLFIILSSLAICFAQVDFCDKKLCRNNIRHIGCNNPGNFGSKCPSGVKLISYNANEQKSIVASHNNLRNKIASGKLAGFKPAQRMTKMEWSPELAKLAELNVKTCKFEHDRCHNTPSFPLSGQNLATWMGYPAPANPRLRISASIDSWFDEYKDADMSIIKKFTPSGLHVGHFTVMANERNNRVGCATVVYVDGLFTVINTACNYGYTNLINNPVYTVGKSGFACKTGKDSQYPALCSTKETYN